ncbi:MAG: anthranilate phosphoribosyltransferase [Verrucomicrobiota bacterium]
MPNPYELLSLTEILRERTDLSREDCHSAASLLTDPAPGHDEKEDFLRALAQKGETPEEVAAFADFFRGKALDPNLDAYSREAIDIVGTGGDKSGTFNFSTATALLIASMGIPVMKHGNRSITSMSGSADLLAALGVPMDADESFLEKSLEENSFCFFFAPSFHPAFKEIMPVRKKLAETGTKTIFNLLGPLINPGRPTFQLMGVYSSEWVAPLASALTRLGLKSALVVHSQLSESKGVDELTVSGKNQIAGAGDLSGETFSDSFTDYGLAEAPLSALKGGDADQNLQILHDVAEGKASAAVEDTLCLNAGASLLACQRVADLGSGIETAREKVRSGEWANWLNSFKEFHSKHA